MILLRRLLKRENPKYKIFAPKYGKLRIMEPLDRGYKNMEENTVNNHAAECWEYGIRAIRVYRYLYIPVYVIIRLHVLSAVFTVI